MFNYTLIRNTGCPYWERVVIITINGQTELVTRPSCPPTNNGTGPGAGTDGHNTVYEKGLRSTTDADTTETTTGTITVIAPDGLASVKIGTQTFTVAELKLPSSASPRASSTRRGRRASPVSRNTGDPDAPTEATVGYTLHARVCHNYSAQDTEILDSIALEAWMDKSSTPVTATGMLSILDRRRRAPGRQRCPQHHDGTRHGDGTSQLTTQIGAGTAR